MAKIEAYQCDVCKKHTEVFTLSGANAVWFGKRSIFHSDVRDVCRKCFETALIQMSPDKPVYRSAGNPKEEEERRDYPSEDEPRDGSPSGWRGPSGPLPPPELP